MTDMRETETKPTPDPTVLTTEALQREVQTLEERDDRLAADIRREIDLLQRELEVRQDVRHRELEAAQKLTDTSLSAMDKATELRLATMHNVPVLIDEAVSHLKELMNEKLSSIDLRFIERDTRTSQAAETSQKALDAALLAAAALVNQQNEANATAATVQTLSFTKQIDQIIVLTERQQKSSDDRLAELKERIDRGDGSSAGARDTRIDQRGAGQLWVAVIGTFLIALSLGATIAALFLGK